MHAGCSGWFGLRKEFCPWMLDTCPVLQEYGNISYKVYDASSAMRTARQGMQDADAVAMPTMNTVDQSGAGRDPSSSTPASHKRGHSGTRSKRHGKMTTTDDVPKYILPVVSIDMPDWAIHQGCARHAQRTPATNLVSVFPIYIYIMVSYLSTLII